MPGHPPSEPQPLSLLLLRISEELHALQAEGRTIEDAIGHAILGGAPSTRETLANLQSIDLIVQSLGELGNYVSASCRAAADRRWWTRMARFAGRSTCSDHPARIPRTMRTRR